MSDVDMDRPVVIVSCDSHVGPKLVEHLRPYCPKKYLEAFDEDAARQRTGLSAATNTLNDKMDDQMRRNRRLFEHPNLQRDGHWDPAARLADMDTDGVAAELIWHFSQNGENLPWVGIGLGNVYSDQLELGAVAYDMYNRWLADFCATDPQRLLGLVYIPSWDIDASIKTLEWAADHGLRCVNFPAPGRPSVKEYNHLDWDPFWSACTDLGFALSTHSSGGPHFDFFGGPGGMQIVAYEGGSFMSRRSVWILTFGMVFERHPELKLVITEQVEGWYAPTMRELDSFYMSFMMDSPLTKLPSRRIPPPECVPWGQLHLSMAGPGRGHRGLRGQRALGSGLSAHRGCLPGDGQPGRRAHDQAVPPPRLQPPPRQRRPQDPW